MANFTPQEIEEMLQEFFNVVGKRQYIGARYVPVFGRKGETSIDWNNTAPYEPLTIVLYQGDTYTSATYVPAGIDISDTRYWVRTSNYNAQVEEYRREVLTFDGRITQNTDDISSEIQSRRSADSVLEGMINNERDQRINSDNNLFTELSNDIDESAALLVPYPIPPNSKFGDNGQILYTDGAGHTNWGQPITPTTEMLEPIINDWLDDHPEATTTVPDNSISEAKIVDGAVTDRKLDAFGVRKTVTNIMNSNGIRTNLTPTNVLYGYFMKRDGSTPAATNYNVYEFSVTAGETYCVGGRYGWDCCACLWLDAGDHPIKDTYYYSGTFYQIDMHFDTIVTAPENAVKLCINGYKMVKEDAYAALVVSESPFTEYSVQEYDANWITGKYYNVSSKQAVDEPGSKYCTFNVNAGEIYVIQTPSNYYGRAWAIYDINNVAISYYANENDFANDVLVMPKGAYSIVVNGLNTDSHNILRFSRILKITKTPSRALRNKTPIKWCALGDSITDSNTLVSGSYRMPNYVEFVSEHLGITAQNKGIGGTGYLANNEGVSTTFAQRALTVDADTYVTTVFGTLNDCYLPDLNIGDVTDAAGASTVCGQVKQTLLNLWSVNPNMLIIVATPCPYTAGNEVDTQASLYQITKDYVQAIINVCKMYSVPVIDLFHESNLRPWEASFRTANYLNGDGQHLNSSAHLRYLAPKFEAEIKRVCGV